VCTVGGVCVCVCVCVFVWLTWHQEEGKAFNYIFNYTVYLNVISELLELYNSVYISQQHYSCILAHWTELIIQFSKRSYDLLNRNGMLLETGRWPTVLATGIPREVKKGNVNSPLNSFDIWRSSSSLFNKDSIFQPFRFFHLTSNSRQCVSLPIIVPCACSFSAVS
jgi:hypothetical protein